MAALGRCLWFSAAVWFALKRVRSFLQMCGGFCTRLVAVGWQLWVGVCVICGGLVCKNNSVLFWEVVVSIMQYWVGKLRMERNKLKCRDEYIIKIKIECEMWYGKIIRILLSAVGYYDKHSDART